MPDARVVVAEQSDWLRRLLLTGLRDHGFDVSSARGGDEALEQVRALAPDCVVCGSRIIGRDGYWLVTQVRAEGSSVGSTPVLFLGDLDDEPARMKALECGADAFVTKPFRIDELVAQVMALVERSRRVRTTSRHAPSIDAPPSSEPANFKGDLEQMSLVSLLTLLEMERRTGKATVRAGATRASVDVQGGLAVSAIIDGQPVDPVTILRASFGWGEGRISFKASLPVEPPGGTQPLRVLLLEARQVERNVNLSEKLPALKRGLDDAPTRRVDAEPSGSLRTLTEEAPDFPPPKRKGPPPLPSTVARGAVRAPPRGRIPATARGSKPPSSRNTRPPPSKKR
jgi:two-component system OmpR family response regulator